MLRLHLAQAADKKSANPSVEAHRKGAPNLCGMALAVQLSLLPWLRARWRLLAPFLSLAPCPLHQKLIFERHAHANAETLSFR
jgi:hypothetical protein